MEAGGGDAFAAIDDPVPSHDEGGVCGEYAPYVGSTSSATDNRFPAVSCSKCDLNQP
jgi:hypothetical protein